ncbi:protocadherin-8-like [Latimeria chalumnae]|uniref:protocadherin-8-like n=1 Tax=Latimeria chalumnae TaxID=7897 RepID=UPI0006D8E84D|nr:PREDICTED: protocadherin-8-like [Latimeria chalumnae]|eukprot:XP_014354481.1 PREDICTED: protocadherin-8-like [Latimeria chalumnae]
MVMNCKGKKDCCAVIPPRIFKKKLCGLFLLIFLTPVVHSKTVKYYAYEEDAPGTVIGTISEDLPIEQADNPDSRFRLMKQFNSPLLKVRENDGQVTVGQRIDREQICKQLLQCLITFDVVSFSKEQFKLIHVEVEVKDINDNSPTFPNSEISVEISENAAVGTRIPIDVAVDEDIGSNAIQRFQVSANSYFSIEMHTRTGGEKYADVILMKKLDREVEASYTLEVEAVDGGNPPRASTAKLNIKVLDFNDNNPVFDQNSFIVELEEDAPVGFLLLELNAVDPDEGVNGEIVYELSNQVSEDIRQLFKIDSKSGRITLESSIDFESRKSYDLYIQAHDLGPNPIPAVCKITVQITDVNDNSPEISITPITSMSAGVAYITESAAVDSFVALISTSDKDSDRNGQVKFNLQGHDHFKLQQAYEDSYMLVTTSSLDREKISEYNLTVIAEDLGSPPFKTIRQFTIRVSDENDNAPLFSKPMYEVSVLENNIPGTYITTVVARDPDLGNNGKVVYKLMDAEVMGTPISTFVSIDSVTGSMFALRSFNYELLKHLEVKIQASDGGVPQLSSHTLIKVKIVDQNDNSPVITHPVLRNGSVDVLVPRKALSGYIVTRIKARDADEGMNSELSYNIISSQYSLFAISKLTGEIFLNRRLGPDVSDAMTVVVSVNDDGRPSLSCTATINFIVTEMAPSSGRFVILSNSSDEDQTDWEISLIIIIALGGGCGLLLVAIIIVALTYKKNDSNCKLPQSSHAERGRAEGSQISSVSESSRSDIPSTQLDSCDLSSSIGSETDESDGVTNSEDTRDSGVLFPKEEQFEDAGTKVLSMRIAI